MLLSFVQSLYKHFAFVDVILTENNCIEDQAEPVWNVNYDAAPDWMKSFFDQVDFYTFL